MTAAADRARAVQELSAQAGYCDMLGSGFYAALLRRSAADAGAGGVVADLMREPRSKKIFAARSLRLMAAVHRLVLTGRARALARHYPSVGGDGDADAAWRPFLRALRSHHDEIRRLAKSGCQTNEVGRSAALLGGFLLLARETGLPLRVLEIGSSAGLNLRWDHFRYEHRRRGWGDRTSPVRFSGVFQGSPPPFEVPATVVERAGCDLAPVDPSSAEGRLSLMASVWADQEQRFHLLKGALEVAAEVPAKVVRADAATWLRRQLRRPTPGVATVVFHSITMMYLTPGGYTDLQDVFADAGTRATADAPLARLALEPAFENLADLPEVRLRTWPGGGERLIARAGYHGRPVRWLGG